LSPAGPSVSREGEAEGEGEAGHKTRPYENATVDGGEAGHKTRPYENGTRDRVRAGHKTRPYEVGTVDGAEAGHKTRPDEVGVFRHPSPACGRGAGGEGNHTIVAAAGSAAVPAATRQARRPRPPEWPSPRG